MKHPAKFSSDILDVCERLLLDCELVLDPFAGTGKVHQLPNHTIGVEIEPEWASMASGTVVGDALALPFADGSFDAICTSPVYGNRFSDHHNAKDGSVRRSYTHDLGRTLHKNNSGSLQWGPKYRNFHEQAWAEALRVLKKNRKSRFVLNHKDHSRGGVMQPVTGWHVTTLCNLGLTLLDIVPIASQGLRHGANRRRAEFELVMSFAYC